MSLKQKLMLQKIMAATHSKVTDPLGKKKNKSHKEFSASDDLLQAREGFHN